LESNAHFLERDFIVLQIEIKKAKMKNLFGFFIKNKSQSGAID
jgi:hypothetical protein